METRKKHFLLNKEGLLDGLWAILVYSIVSGGLFIMEAVFGRGLPPARIGIIGLVGLLVAGGLMLLPFLFLERYVLGQLIKGLEPTVLRLLVLGIYLLLAHAFFYEGEEPFLLGFARQYKKVSSWLYLLPFFAYFGLAFYAERGARDGEERAKSLDILDD